MKYYFNNIINNLISCNIISTILSDNFKNLIGRICGRNVRRVEIFRKTCVEDDEEFVEIEKINKIIENIIAGDLIHAATDSNVENTWACCKTEGKSLVPLIITIICIQRERSKLKTDLR